jgi:hypothetical protein
MMRAPSQELLAGQCRQCGKLLKKRQTGRVRLFCSARCRKAHSRFPAGFVTPGGGSAGMSRNSKISPTKSATSKGQNRDRASQLTLAQQLFCDSVGREAIAASNRQNARFWREAAAKADAGIEANGYLTEPEWREAISPDGVKCYVTRFRQSMTSGSRTDIPDDLSIPVFLKRTAESTS